MESTCNPRHLAWVLESLKSGAAISKFDAYYRVGCANLSVCVEAVRSIGYTVNSRVVTYRTGQTVKEYLMGPV